jgi:hypothetical protein
MAFSMDHVCSTCRAMYNGRTCLQPGRCYKGPSGWLQRDVERAATQKVEWTIRDLKRTVPNRLHGVYVTDEGEAI